MNLHVREDPDGYDEDASRLASELLLATELVSGGVPHRLVEIELYLFGRRHRDPFAHRDRRQLEPGRFYLHRNGPSLRSGSFKGLDLTFGRTGVYGGALIRSLSGPEDLVCGPSLCVDRLLACCSARDVAVLDARVADRSAFDPGNDVHLRPRVREDLPILRTARVGLTLRRTHPDKPAYLGRPDRFLTAPRDVRKGRVQTLVALHELGATPARIRDLTGSPPAAIRRVIAAYSRGLRERSIEPGLDLAHLLGAWRARHG